MAQPPSRISHALLEPAHLALLVVALLALVFSHFSTFLLVGVVALELFYLLVFAQTPAYGRRIALKEAGQAVEARQQELAARAAQLNRDDRRRYSAVERLHQEVTGLIEGGASREGQPLPISRAQVDDLKAAALEFSLAHRSFREQLAKADPEKLRAELVQLQSQPAGSSEVEQARKQTREILQQRIERLGAMQEQMGTLDARLQVIEQSLRLLKEQLSTMNAPAQLAQPVNVGELVRDVEATRRTLAEMGALELRS